MSLAEIRQRLENDLKEADEKNMRTWWEELSTQERDDLFQGLDWSDLDPHRSDVLQAMWNGWRTSKLAQLKLLDEIEGEIPSIINEWFKRTEYGGVRISDEGKEIQLKAVSFQDIEELKQKLLGVGTNSQSIKREDKQ